MAGTRRSKVDRILKLIPARIAGPYVANTMVRQMLRPFCCNDSGTTLRTLIHRYPTHGTLPLLPTFLDSAW